MAQVVAPDLAIPPSKGSVSVSIIDTTAKIRGAAPDRFYEPRIKGHDYLGAPAFSFLIQHPSLNRSLVFDLGIRKDWWNLSPFLQNHFKRGGHEFHIQKNVRDILNEHGVDVSGIEAVVWSHWHFDHTGDPSTFPPSTALIVGPGFKDAFMPGYPVNQNSPLLESDFAGREVREVRFDGPGATRIGRFRAHDYFGDGAFYLLDAPGHALGHLAALARVTVDPPSFIFLGGDACHHMGELRPSAYLPLPAAISPHPFASSLPPCPGAMFEPLLRGDRDRRRPIYEAARSEGTVHHDVDETLRTVGKMQEADAREDVLILLAHDEHILDVVDFFPKTANAFVEKGWVGKSRWRFLKDFSVAIGWEGEMEGKRDWSPSKKEAGSNPSEP
jgi:glyoxylase-like metal-dependent hydrolase (beta-lactamase superfamily II)